MDRSWLRYLLSAAALLAAMNFLSCGNQRRLVSIEIRPSSATFLGPQSGGPPIVFTALGTYQHPPDTRDITALVAWKTDNPGLLNIAGGSVTPNGQCGIGNLSASVNDSGNLIIGYATVTVDDPTNPLCPGGKTTQAVVSVTPIGAGAGTVTSVPAGISCPATCGAQFTVGDTILLTATPTSPSTFGGWGTGCTSVSGNMCSITVPTGSTSVTATFN
jgi:hypothetical protein